MRVDEIDGHKPGLALPGHGLSAQPQPAAGLGTDILVVVIPTMGHTDNVTNADVILEAIALDNPGQLFLGQSHLVVGAQFPGQMPLAFVGGIIAGFTQHVSQRSKLWIEAIGPWKIQIVEQPGMLDMLTGVDDRAR